MFNGAEAILVGIAKSGVLSVHEDAVPVDHLPVLLVALDDDRLALPLASVVEVLPAIALAPLPIAPDVVRGIANVRGRVLPVLDLRTRLGGCRRPPRPDDHVVVCRVGDRTVGVWLDHAIGLAVFSGAQLVPISEVGRAEHVEGVALLPDGTVLVCDVRSFLSADEAIGLGRALEHASQVS
jgi:purine-binding chemotaxis protein CheW